MTKELLTLRHGLGGAWRERFNRIKPLWIPICIMTGVYLLGISAILRANFNYMDDMVRVNQGVGGYDDACARFVSEAISVLLHADPYLSDISPLPQILAAVLLAAASVTVLYIVTGKTRYSVWEYAAVLPLGLSPYMLECLSFKYDSPYMALSVLASVLPLLLEKESGRRWLLGVATFVGTAVVCTTYQAASGILPMFTVLLAFKKWQEKKPWREILWFVAVAAAGYCGAMVLFKLFFVKPAPLIYVDTTLPPIRALLPHVAAELKTFYSLVWGYFDKKWLLLSGGVFLSFVWISVRDTARSRWLALPMALAAAALLLLLAFGLYPVMNKPLVQPRTMYGFGATLAFPAVYAASAKKAVPAKLICFALSWCFFVFAFTYGNALYSQKVYTDFRIEEVIDSIKDTDKGLFAVEPTVLQVDGSVGYAPAIRGTVNRFPMLEELIPSTFSGDNAISVYGFIHYYDLPYLGWDSSYDLRAFSLPVISDTLYHTIYGNEYFLLIELK